MRRAIILILCCAAAMSAQSELPAQLRNIGVDQKLNATVPPSILVMRDESGAKSRSANTSESALSSCRWSITSAQCCAISC